LVFRRDPMQKIFVRKRGDDGPGPFLASTALKREGVITLYGETADDAARQVQTVLVAENPPITVWEVVDLSAQDLVIHMWEVPTYDPHYAEGDRWYAWTNPTLGTFRGPNRDELVESLRMNLAWEDNEPIPVQALRIVEQPPRSK